MNHKLKRKWVNALRSGRYVQCFGKLRSYDYLGKDTYCALGLLAEVAEIKAQPNTEGIYNQLRMLIGDEEVEFVCRLNDASCLPFEEIADWVEEKL